MSRARDLGSLINSTAAGKNLIINGGFDIWQRGISITNGYPIHGADRWLNYGNGNGTMSRQLVSDTTNLPNIQYCARLQRTPGSTSTSSLYMSQSIETTNSIPLAGKTVTFSYYARRGANFSGVSFSISNMLVIETVVGTGTDQNCIAGFTGGSNPSGGVSYQPITTTWSRYSFSFVVPANSTEIGFNIFFPPTGTAGAADHFEITGIQLELGSSATPFSRAGGDIQGELTKCQRYYYKAISESLYGPIGTGKAYSSNILNINVPLPVKMRSIPSVIASDLSALSTFQFETGASAGTTPTSIATNPNLNSSTYGSVDVVKASAFTTGAFYYLMGSNNTNSFIGFNAEL
jgi:hypothetical protein